MASETPAAEATGRRPTGDRLTIDLRGWRAQIHGSSDVLVNAAGIITGPAMRVDDGESLEA